MRASVAGLFAACALIGIPRLTAELREYWRESQKPAPLGVSIAPESRPAASAAPIPTVPAAPALPKQAPVQLVTLQREPAPLPSTGTGAKPPSPASQPNEAELIPLIQKELARLGLYDGQITDRWSRPVRGAVREFLRKNGGRARHPQPTAELLAALKAAEPVKKQTASPPEGPRPEEKPARPSGSSVKESPPKQSEPAPKQGMAVPVPAPAPVPAAQNDDYLPPWMTAKTEQARLAAKLEAGRSDTRVEAGSREVQDAPSSIDDAPKRHFHRRHHAERPWRTRHRYGAYYPSRRAMFFPF